MSDALNRLQIFLADRGQSGSIEALTPDASTREYFRVAVNDTSAVACVYPDPFVEREQSYLDVTRLFLEAGLPVAKIIDFDERLGVIILEDLGDRILRDVLLTTDDSTRESLLDEAIAMIARIQHATEAAYRLGSIASRLRFDTEKLLWELDFFKTHYFTTFKSEPLSPAVDSSLSKEFLDLSRELEERATVLCHRDFHAANLMLDGRDQLRIIDHQDARIGPVAYDLVSLLLDRVTEPPSAEFLGEKRRLFLAERDKIGMPVVSESEFAAEFRLQTVQRCLKAIGTFSFQSANRGKTYFIPFIKPMFEIVLRAVQNLHRYPTITSVVANEID